MPFDLAQSLQSLGVAAELGMEIQRQIAAGAGNINMLLEVGLVPLDAKNLAAGITAGDISPLLLAEGSIVPPVAVVIAKSVNAPRVTAVPSITGTAQVGETLTRVAGTYAGTPTPAVTWVWTADGVAIAGTEDAATYDPVVGDIGEVIRVVETATNTNGSTTATSLPTAAVIAA